MLQKEAQPARSDPFIGMDHSDKAILQHLADGNSYQEVGQFTGMSRFNAADRVSRLVDAYGVLEKERKGYVQYTNGLPALIKLIQAGVASGNLTHEMPEGPIHYLSQREHEVVEGLISGGSHQEIAEKLCISPKTVHAHANHIHRKIGYKNVLHLAARMAYRDKLGI